MHVSEADTELLKTWIIKRLEDVSDADADVLADYVLALVRNDEPESSLKANATEQLRDFLQDGSEKFVSDVLRVIKSKAYDPKYKAPLKSTLKPTASTYKPHTHQTFNPSQLTHPNQSRKRNWQGPEADEHDVYSQGFDAGMRPSKHAKRDGNRNTDTRNGRKVQQPGLRNGHAQQPIWQQAPSVPELPPFDPNNPMAAFLAMQQAMLQHFPALAGMQPDSGMKGHTRKQLGQRCFDYDTKGFCARGEKCPYKHESDSFIVAADQDEYDPTNATLMHPVPARSGSFNIDSSPPNHISGRTQGKGRTRSSKRRHDLSMVGQNFDRSNTSIVVEQIPPDHLDESIVRSFFREFGNVTQVQLQPQKHLAIVTYDSWDAANAAYESPKVVFENRFVKVFWLKNSHLDVNAINKHSSDHDELQVNGKEEPQIDLEEFAKKQEEAQRRHEETRNAILQAEKQHKEIQTRLAAIEQEKRKIIDQLRDRIGESAVSSIVTMTEGESAQTKQLKATLASLEAEARSLGLDPDAVTAGLIGIQHNEGGGNRGRGSFSRRGRGSARGRWARAGARGGSFGGAVKRLDNRTKTLLFAFPESSVEEVQERLRELMLVKGLDPEVRPHPDDDHALLLQFDERYKAEIFSSAVVSELRSIGKMELSWFTSQADSTAIEEPGSGPDAQNTLSGLSGTSNMDHERNGQDRDNLDSSDMDGDDDPDRWVD